MKLKVVLVLFTTVVLLSSLTGDGGSSEILLWPDGAPGSEGKASPEKIRISDQGDSVISNVHKPSIKPYLPEPANNAGVAVIIAPGGGHSELWISHEGYAPARWLQQHGIAAFVLKYRLAREANSTYTIDKDELADIQRAIRLVKSRAAEWHIDTAKVGVMGFSAGGELAALSAMRYASIDIAAPDPINRESDRPAFQGLIYPGNIQRYEVDKSSPPAFIAAGFKDRQDISEGAAQLYLKYKQLNIPAELHIYAGAGHGFGIRSTNKGAITQWPEEFRLWLTDLGLIKNK